jgi:hypothetical protein
MRSPCCLYACGPSVIFLFYGFVPYERKAGDYGEYDLIQIMHNYIVFQTIALASPQYAASKDF